MRLWPLLMGAVLAARVGVFAAAAQQPAVPTVGRWERFEATIDNPTGYADPYRDVDLRVTYTRPDGSAIDFWGFYDGGSSWMIRFMPDQLGEWRYRASFSDGRPGANGSFRVVPSGLPGPIGKDEANPIWFGFRSGRHLLVRSFHVGDRFFAANWDDPANPADGNRRTRFLDWAQRQGYNTLSIASHYLNRETEGRGRGWDTPDLWPLDAAEYRELEVVLDDLARRQIVVYPFAGFFGRDSDFPRDPAEQERYIRYTIARVGPYWNVLFMVGGPEPLLRSNSYLTMEDLARLAGAIRRYDPFGHPVSVHNPSTSEDAFRDEPWADYGILQGPKTTDLARLSRALLESHHPTKPLYVQETLWPGNTLGHPSYSLENIRKNGYVIVMSAGALNFADMNGTSSSGFSGTLELADRVQERHDAIRRVWDFFETIPFYRMSPCQELVSAGYCLGERGRGYLVYLPSGGGVDIRLPPGRYAVEWIDARNTSHREQGEPTRNGRGLTAPAGGDDWLVYLTR